MAGDEAESRFTEEQSYWASCVLLAVFLWEKVFFSEPAEQLASPTFSWGRVGTGLFMVLGTLLVASGLYLFFVKALRRKPTPSLYLVVLYQLQRSSTASPGCFG
jgi:hypothetical protein